MRGEQVKGMKLLCTWTPHPQEVPPLLNASFHVTHSSLSGISNKHLRKTKENNSGDKYVNVS